MSLIGSRCRIPTALNHYHISQCASKSKLDLVETRIFPVSIRSN